MPLSQWIAQRLLPLRSTLVGLQIAIRAARRRSTKPLYPQSPANPAARFRGVHELDADRCDGCGQCVAACPTRCIDVRTTGNANRGLETPHAAAAGRPTSFSIDYAACLFCSLCVDACPQGCLRPGHRHDVSGGSREEMVIDLVTQAEPSRVDSD